MNARLNKPSSYSFFLSKSESNYTSSEVRLLNFIMMVFL